MEETYLDDWEICRYADDTGDYLMINHLKRPGSIQIKLEVEGYIVDIWNKDETDVIATASALYADLAPSNEI